MSNAIAVPNVAERTYQAMMSFYAQHKKAIIITSVLFALALLSLDVIAATTTDAWANSGYDFIYAAATGKFTRAVCIAGGIIAIITAAGSGRYIVALGGVVLAMFGFLSPTLINAIFGTALI